MDSSSLTNNTEIQCCGTYCLHGIFISQWWSIHKNANCPTKHI